MLDAGVIVPVTESTPWINSFVIVETTDQHGNPKMHICLDPTPLNKAVITYAMPSTLLLYISRSVTGNVSSMKKAHT